MEFAHCAKLLSRFTSRGSKLARFNIYQKFSSNSSNSKSRLFIKVFVTSTVFPAGYFIFRSAGLTALTKSEKTLQNSSPDSDETKSNSDSNQASEIDSVEGEDNSDGSDYWNIAVKARFQSFASVEYNGELFMTPLDLLEACVEMEPLYVRSTRKKLTSRNLRAFLDRTPSKSNGSTHLLRDIGDKGLFSYSDFLFILQLLSSTKSSRRAVRVAFNMLDVNSDHTIDKKEFSVLSYLLHLAGQQRRLRAGRRAAVAAAKHEKESFSNFWAFKLLGRFYRKEIAPSIRRTLSRVGLAESTPLAIEAATGAAVAGVAADDSTAAEESAGVGAKEASDVKEPAGNAIAALAEAAQAAALASPTVDTTLSVLFFGRKGRDIVTEQDFFTFIKNLQEEILECEFLKFASLSERGDFAGQRSSKLYYEGANHHYTKSSNTNWSHFLPWHWFSSERATEAEPEGGSAPAGYEGTRSGEPDMSMWQAAQMILRYSEYADTISALRTAVREESKEEDAQPHPAAGDQPAEAKRKRRLLQMVASFGVGAKDSTLEHFIAVQDTLKNMKERIALSDMRLFMSLLNSLEDFEAAIALHILTGQQFNRTEFERAVYAATSQRMAKPLIDLVFVLFDLDGDGHLSREEFLSVLHDRLHSCDAQATGRKQNPQEEQKEKRSPFDLDLQAENFRKCMRREVTKNS